MTTFTIEAAYSNHDQGTKYYQIFWITNSKDKKAAMVTHWGAIRPGKNKYPKYHGEAEVHTFAHNSESPRNSKQNAKKKRGYATWTTEYWRDIEAADFIETLEDLFKDREVSQIKAHFHEAGDWATKVSIPEIEAIQEQNEKAVLAMFEQSNPAPSSHNDDYGTW
jgi:predicted DNA-binding WGR domain protein